MANLTIKEVSSGTETRLEQVDLGMTNTELVEGLISEGVLHRLSDGQKHLVVAKDNSVAKEIKTLVELGFIDEDTVQIVTKHVAAKI